MQSKDLPVPQLPPRTCRHTTTTDAEAPRPLRAPRRPTQAHRERSGVWFSVVCEPDLWCGTSVAWGIHLVDEPPLKRSCRARRALDEAVIDANAVPLLVDLLRSDERAVRLEAAWAIANATKRATPRQIEVRADPNSVPTDDCERLTTRISRLMRNCTSPFDCRSEKRRSVSAG